MYCLRPATGKIRNNCIFITFGLPLQLDFDLSEILKGALKEALMTIEQLEEEI